MIVAIVFAQVWGVLQLVVLGSLSRTTRVRTVLAGIAVGLYACAPVALLLQLSWIHLAAALTGTSTYTLLSIGGYTVDPFIEEVVKVLPVALLLMVPVVRRQWSITDCVLLGAAAGSGFGLAEDLYRFGSVPHLATANSAGWALATNISIPQVPSVGTTLMSWLPAGAAPWDIFAGIDHGYPWVNLHLAWSAVAGLGVGLIALRKGTVARVAGIGLALYVALDHAAWNARSQGSWVSDLLVSPFAAVRGVLPFLPLVAVAVAWWLDRVQQSGRELAEPILAAEQTASPRWVGTLRAAVKRLPWSVPSVYGLSRVRRAYSTARARGSRDELSGLRRLLGSTRDRIDRTLLQPQPPSALSRAWTPGVWRTALRRPVVIIWLALIAPAFLWGVVGGWPQTAWLQKTVTGPLAWNVVRVLSLAAQAWLAWRVFAAARSWLTTIRRPLGDDAAILGLRIACGVGALGLGGYALLRSFSVARPQYSLALAAIDHVAQAYGSLGVDGALMYAGASAFALPPGFAFEPSAASFGAPGDAHSPTLPPGVSFDDGSAARPGGANAAPRQPAAAVPALPPNPYDAADPALELPPNPYDTDVEEAAAQSAYANAVAAYAAEQRSYRDDLIAAGKADLAAGPDADAHAAADAYARHQADEQVLAANVDAAKAAVDLAAGHSTYEDGLAAARAADAAARAADPYATPHATRDFQNTSQLTADELRARVAAADAAAKAAAADRAYLDDLAAAKADDAAASKADPDAAPHAADDVRAAAEAARNASAAEVAAANARADAARALRDPVGVAVDEARAADARVDAAWYGSDAPYQAAKEEAAAAHARADAAAADAAAKEAARAAAEQANEDKRKRLKS
jgi:RsiW-degrading membrane proteinase PrsW (M82 family)